MVKSALVKLSDPEYRLITAIQSVNFGEMFGVEVQHEEPTLEYLATQQEQDLIFVIRSGYQYIDVLTVHNGQPTLAELDQIIDGFRCRKRVRFPLTMEPGKC